MSALDDIVSTMKGAVQNLSQLITTISNTFPRINGTFTMSAGASTVVGQTSISASSIVLYFPTNAAAALLLRSSGLYLSARTVGASFTLTTQTGVAAGTETFQYVVVNPS